MGEHPNIGFTKFPKQGSYLGRHVSVCFDYNPKECLDGVIVRCDSEEPGRLIIHLSDDRYVLSTECQYSF